MKVYIHRYENLEVFSTARKVLESLKDEGWSVSVCNSEVPINEQNIKRLITELNKKGYLYLTSDNETSTIEVETVR